MTSAAPKLPTFEELYAEIERLPSGVTGEIVKPGVLRTMSRPARPHRYTAKRALVALGAFDVDQGGSGWWIEPEPEVRFGSRLLVPDLAGWRVERVPERRRDRLGSMVAAGADSGGRAGGDEGCPSGCQGEAGATPRTSPMNDRQRQLLASVDRAFRGVELGSGVSLHETRVLDDYGTDEQRRAARAPDEKHDWRNLIGDPDLPFVCGIVGGLSFFDAAGMRFHLPACFSRAIQDPEGTRVGDMVQSLLFHLTHLHDHQLERFAVLDDAQRRCVREVLEYLREELDDSELDQPELDQAILGYWSQGVAR